MVNWTHAPGKVEKYRVVYYPTRGGKPEEVIRRRCFQTVYSQALRFCTVVKIRQKWMYKEIILSQAFTVVGLNTFPCVQVVLMSRAYGIYIFSSYFHQRTCRTGHESISNTTYTDLIFFFCNLRNEWVLRLRQSVVNYLARPPLLLMFSSALGVVWTFCLEEVCVFHIMWSCRPSRFAFPGCLWRSVQMRTHHKTSVTDPSHESAITVENFCCQMTEWFPFPNLWYRNSQDIW